MLKNGLKERSGRTLSWKHNFCARALSQEKKRELQGKKVCWLVGWSTGWWLAGWLAGWLCLATLSFWNSHDKVTIKIFERRFSDMTIS